MFDVTAIGELLIDFTPAGRSESGAYLYERNAGGAPANVLAAVAKLGGRSAFIGKVGNDTFGFLLRDTLNEYGISAEGLSFTGEASTTLAFVSLNEKGDRDFMFCRKPGADTLLKASDLPETIIRQSRIFHFGSLSFTDEPSRSAVLLAAEMAKKAGAVISYDPNYRAPLWESKAKAENEMQKGVVYADIIKVSEEELLMLTGCEDIRPGCNALLEKGVKTVLVTLGPGGCIAAARNGFAHLHTYDTPVLDTTGAGDAFTGAFLHLVAASGKRPGELSFASILEFAGFANAAGALCASSRGAMASMAEESRIRACMESTPKLCL